MARLSSTGSWAASPYRDREDFKKALLKLCPTHAFSDSAVQDFYGALSIVVGKWFSEQQRVEVSPVAKSLRSMGISLDEAARTLRGHQTGFHTYVEIEIVSQIRGLSLEGLTFSEVLGGLRTDLAKRYLADNNLSISEIAWLLGYQEVSAFTHAFRRWTGKSPRETRSHLG